MTETFLLGLGTVIMGVALVALLAYPKLQWMSHRRLGGRWRIFGYLPLVVMTAVVLYTLVAFAAESNLWPLVLIFTAPLASAYLAVLLLMHRYFIRGDA